MEEVSIEAKVMASAGPYATGNLARHIVVNGPRILGSRIEGTVEANTDYAMAVHEGAKIHWIFPKAAPGVVRFGSRRRPQLKFFWRKVGRVVYLPHIPGSPNKVGLSHPGVRHPRKFLTIPLRAAAIRHGLRYQID